MAKLATSMVYVKLFLAVVLGLLFAGVSLFGLLKEATHEELTAAFGLVAAAGALVNVIPASKAGVAGVIGKWVGAGLKLMTAFAVLAAGLNLVNATEFVNAGVSLVLRNYLKMLTHKCIEGFEGRIVWFLQNDQERP